MTAKHTTTDLFRISILAHKNDKAEKEADGYKPLSLSSPDQLITALNTYHCVFADLKNGKRDDPQVLQMMPVIKLDVDAEGGALGEVVAILDELGLEYVSVPSQSDLDYKRHIIVFCAGVYHSDNALQLKAGYIMQVEHFLTETGIDISWLDERPLYATSGYLAPASCGKLTVDQADAKSVYHTGKKYELLDLAGNGIVVPDKPDTRNRSSVKGLVKVKGEKFDLKDVDAGDINILEKDNTIYQYGKLVRLADVVSKIKAKGDANTIYGGFGCPRCNPEHGKDSNLDPRTSPYAFGFISTGGDVVFKCTGNACSKKPLYMMDSMKDSKKAKYRIYRMNDQTGNLRMAFFDKEANAFLTPSSGSKHPMYSLSGGLAKGINMGLLKDDTDERGLKKYLAKCDEVEVIRHGYKKRGFAQVKGRDIFWDAPIPRFKVEPKDATPIVKTALSIFNKDHKTAGQSTALILLGSTLFGKKQAMAILALVGDPASAKTFYAQEIIKFYWGKEWVGSIAPDEHNWGDIEYGKRHICYNDTDKMTEVMKRKLTGKVKRRATEGEDGTLNMKGGSILDSTPTSQSITSNYADALPVDSEGKDRRIYIPVMDHDAKGVDPDKMAKAFDPVLGGKQAIQNRIDLICHLYKIWLDAKEKDTDAVRTLLFVKVPMTEEKQEIMSNNLADGKALINDLASKDDYEMGEALTTYLKMKDDVTIGELETMIIKKRVDAGKNWFLPQDLLIEIRYNMSSWKNYEKPNTRQAAESFIGKKRFAPLSVNGISGQRGIKIKK